MIDRTNYTNMNFSAAMTDKLFEEIKKKIDKGPAQEDLTFVLYKLSVGKKRCTAILQKPLFPDEQDRVLQGNVSFSADYLIRVLKAAGKEYGIAFLHSHLGPGWQGMSKDDIVAEKSRLASTVAGSTGLPLVGLTMGTDGSWSARFWLRVTRNEYEINWAETVRVVGESLTTTFHPQLLSAPDDTKSQTRTVSVWGEKKQADIARVHVGIVGLGSVGSIVAESLSRIGISHITLIDHDIIQEHNLDRTLGAGMEDVKVGIHKVKIAERQIKSTHTSSEIEITVCQDSLLSLNGYKNALDCDVIFSCVDRPWPRHLLNAIAYSHLIPVIDGGIYAKVEDEKFLHADWRIHTISPGRPCMVCINALKLEHISLDMHGDLDNPQYIQGLPHEFKSLVSRQNIFPFSMSVAAHEVIQFIGLVTGNKRIGGKWNQMYHCYPGNMETLIDITECESGCEYSKLTATATNLSGNLMGTI